MVTINQLVETAEKISGKVVKKMYKLDAPTGVRGRNSNNDLIKETWLGLLSDFGEGILKHTIGFKQKLRRKQMGIAIDKIKELVGNRDNLVVFEVGCADGTDTKQFLSQFGTNMKLYI